MTNLKQNKFLGNATEKWYQSRSIIWGAGMIIFALPSLDWKFIIAGVGAIAWRLLTKTELKLK